jgi:hypothetical protein
MASSQPRGATVAFDSIDGPPPGQFQMLVRNLNEEAQARRLAVISREASSAYRVRGYLAAEVVKGRTTVSWVWDVFDRDEHRALRIDGAETVKQSAKSADDGWRVADDAMLRRIAHSSMDRLAAFLTSPDVAPPVGVAQTAYVGVSDHSPEAAGIFRIFRAHADPVSAEAAAAGDDVAGPVPLPPRRPGASAAVPASGRAGQASASL